jgi:hypothetical protein
LNFSPRFLVRLMAILVLVGAAGFARGADRLAWTGAVTQVEGAAGGGLVPWALIAGLGTADQIGGSAFATYVDTGDFSLRGAGVAIGFYDRFEVSFARQRFAAGTVISGLTLGQDIVGLKVKLAGDAVFAPDRWMPQIAAGVLAKRTLDFDAVPRLIGARKSSDVEIYVAATKLYFAAIAGRNLVLNATLRRSRANQLGLLGFGGDRRVTASYCPEASAGVFISERILAGAEWRSKADNLGAFSEGAAKDLFIAWNPRKQLSATLAWVDLGVIANKPAQRGLYASFWFGF